VDDRVARSVFVALATKRLPIIEIIMLAASFQTTAVRFYLDPKHSNSIKPIH